MQNAKRSIINIIVITLITLWAYGCSYAEGGMECLNEPPDPIPVGKSSWITVDTGFTETSVSEVATNTPNFTAAVDTCNGNVRISFNAAGEFPFAKPLTFYHNSRISTRNPAGVGWSNTYNIMLFEHPSDWHFDDVRIVQANGYRSGYSLDIDGNLRGEHGIHSHVIHLESGGYLVYTNDNPDMVASGNTCYCFGLADATGKCKLLYIKSGDRVVRFSYVVSGPAVGELESFVDEASGRTGRFIYDSTGKLESIVSLNGCKTTFSFNNAGDISTATSILGKLTFDYDSNHNITDVTDGLGGHCARFAYSGSARGTEFRNTSGQEWNFHYNVDERDLVKSVAFGPKNATPSVYEFNERRLVISASVPGKPKTEYYYSADKRYLGSHQY